jgi:glutamine amidotransferase-like uncharacterized protein
MNKRWVWALLAAAWLAAAWLAAAWLAAGAGRCAAADKIRVAVFQGEGVSRNVTVLLGVLAEHKDLAVVRITADEIRAGRLADCDVVVFPGGSGSGQGKALEDAGRTAVRKFVAGGGGLVGICAGAYLATNDYTWSLGVLDAKVIDRQHWDRGSGDVAMRLTPAGKKLLGLPDDELTILYYQGPLLAPGGKDDVPDYQELATYAGEIAENGAPRGVMPGTTAIATGTFGGGRVVCFSPHPERTPALKGLVHRAISWTREGQ